MLTNIYSFTESKNINGNDTNQQLKSNNSYKDSRNTNVPLKALRRSVPLQETNPSNAYSSPTLTSSSIDEHNYKEHGKYMLPSNMDMDQSQDLSSELGSQIFPQDGKPFSCSICPRSFDRQYSLERHLILHRGDKKYECNECDAKYSLAANLTRHQRQVHMCTATPEAQNVEPRQQHSTDTLNASSHGDKENLNLVYCSDCPLSYQMNSDAYKIHRYIHEVGADLSADPFLESRIVQESMSVFTKDGAIIERKQTKFLCTDCTSNYSTWEELIEHSAHHGLPTPPPFSLQPHQIENMSNTASTRHIEKPHKCELCYKSFASEERLSKHMAVHGSDDSKPLSCKECGKRFLNNSALACHSKVHVGNGSNINGVTGYDCPICGTPFEQIHSLKEHVHVHRDSATGRYSCPHCQKSFPEYSMIRKHIRAFHSAKRFQCSECEKAFTGADKLKAHMVKHSDIKEFECDECGKQFKRKDKLKEHAKRMHSTNVAQIDQPINERREFDTMSNKQLINNMYPITGTRSKKNKKKLKGKQSQRATETATEILPGNGIKVSQPVVNLDASETKESKETSKPESAPVSIPSKRHIPKVPATDYERFTFKCHKCLLGFKRRGMLVNHLVKRHPEIALNSVSELNMPIMKPSKDYYCQYCNKVYKSSSKRKVHILKNHPGAPLPLSARETSSEAVNGIHGQDPTFSATVGSIKLQPHRCKQCHRQYASNAKLLQHQRKKHLANIPSSGANQQNDSSSSKENVSSENRRKDENVATTGSQDENAASDEWDLLTSNYNKSDAHLSSKTNSELSFSNQYSAKPQPPSAKNDNDSALDNKTKQTSHHSDDEDDGGGVALQYIVHDNGDLEVVQRAMPSASFSDRRSVDTPAPNDPDSVHPDAMECANAERVSIKNGEKHGFIPSMQYVVNSTVSMNNEVAHSDKGAIQSTSNTIHLESSSYKLRSLNEQPPGKTEHHFSTMEEIAIPIKYQETYVNQESKAVGSGGLMVSLATPQHGADNPFASTSRASHLIQLPSSNAVSLVSASSSQPYNQQQRFINANVEKEPQTALHVHPSLNFEQAGTNRIGALPNARQDTLPYSKDSIEIVLADNRTIMFPAQSQNSENQTTPCTDHSLQPSGTHGRFQAGQGLSSILPHGSSHQNQANIVNLKAQPANSYLVRSKVSETPIQENLVTVNADHIAPMTVNYNSQNSNSNKESMKQRKQPRQGTSSYTQQNHNVQNPNQSRPSTSQEPPSPIDDAQSQTERELTEWLNDAYKRKR